MTIDRFWDLSQQAFMWVVLVFCWIFLLVGVGMILGGLAYLIWWFLP